MDAQPRIIAAVDLSEITPAVYAAAVRQCVRLGAPLTVVHALGLMPEEEEGPLLPSLRRMIDRAKEETVEQIRAMMAEVETPASLPVEVVATSSAALRGILKTVRAHNAPLVVLGGGPPRIAIAATLSRVARHLICPALVVRHPVPGGYHAPLVGVDFSPESLAALEAARKVAEPGARWTFCYVYPCGEYSHLVDDQEAFVESGQAKLRQWVADHAADLDGETVVRCGNPKRLLLDEVAERESDLLVCGTHGHAGLAHLLLGGVAEVAARTSPCDVLLGPGSTPDAEPEAT